MPQEGRIIKDDSIERLPGKVLSNDKDSSKHSDEILREGECKHSFIDMPVMLYLKQSLTCLFLPQDCKAPLNLSQIICLNS